MPLHVSSTCAHHQEVRIALHSLWHHHIYRWPSRAQVERGLGEWRHNLCTRQPPIEVMIPEGGTMQFWPPDDEHMCSKHVEAWNKLIVKQKLCASSWLITEINILVGNRGRGKQLHWGILLRGNGHGSLVVQQVAACFCVWCGEGVFWGIRFWEWKEDKTGL